MSRTLLLHFDLGTENRHEHGMIHIGVADFAALAKAMVKAEQKEALKAFADAISGMPFLTDD